LRIGTMMKKSVLTGCSKTSRCRAADGRSSATCKRIGRPSLSRATPQSFLLSPSLAFYTNESMSMQCGSFTGHGRGSRCGTRSSRPSGCCLISMEGRARPGVGAAEPGEETVLGRVARATFPSAVLTFMACKSCRSLSGRFPISPSPHSPGTTSSRMQFFGNVQKCWHGINVEKTTVSF
jgi:hypothetical protein